MTEDLVDKAISFVADTKQVAPNKPFFMYFATGAMHAPHHVPKEWADKYQGMFDDGWDAYREKVFARQKELGIVPQGAELSRHDPDVQIWDTLPEDERKLYARMMEVYAGFLEHTDFHIGRLFDFLKKIGECDNTLIMAISDNGASAEGGPTGSVNESHFFNNIPESAEENMKAIDDLGGPDYLNHYAWGWTWAGNTPFRRWKRETYRGGVTDPFIVHYPNGIQAEGEVRMQFTHAVDMVPTVLDLLGLEAPTNIKGVTQAPIEGISFAQTLEGAEGVIFSHGGSDGGYSLYMKDGKLHYVHNYVTKEYFQVESVDEVPAGHHQLRFEFEVTGPPDIPGGKGVPARAQLYFDDKLVGQADFPYTTPLMFGVAGGALECCRDSGAPVTPEYAPPFEFSGTIHSVTVDVSGELIKDEEAEMRQIMARQ